MVQDYFESLNIFSGNEIEELIQRFIPKKLSKSEFFVKEGNSFKEIAFIQTGIFRSYYTSDDGTENTFCFRFPNNLLAPYSAFITGNPSMETMQAITDANLLVIKKKEIEQLINENPNWTKFLKLNAEHEYLELEKRFFQMQKDNATQRYVSLLQNQPEYSKRYSFTVFSVLSWSYTKTFEPNKKRNFFLDICPSLASYAFLILKNKF